MVSKTLQKAQAPKETDLERCVRQVREKLAEKPNPDNPKGYVICNLTWQGAINLVAAELSHEERKRVVFRVKA